MRQEIKQRLEKAVKERVFPGCVFGIVKANGERDILAAGHFTYESDSPEVKEDSIYDMASITKSIPGSCSLLKLIDEGKLDLEDRLADYLPEFGNFENKKEVKIQHLLTYTLSLDISSLSDHKNKSPDEIIRLVVESPLKDVPGLVHRYTNATAVFTSLLVEKITGETLDVFADKNFFKPLGMSRSTFFPEKFDKSEIVPTEVDEWRGREVHGEVHDESTFTMRNKYVTAVAGLFSTPSDMLNFTEMLLYGGIKDGKRYFSENIVKEMHTNQLESINAAAGLGWAMDFREAMGIKCSKEAFCKSGFTGTFVAIDPRKGLAYCLFSNRVYPKRPKDMSAINSVRRDVANIIFD